MKIRPAALLLFSMLLPLAGQADPAPGPRLVLQLTVDGMRGDMLARYRSHFGKEGFGYLLERGAVYTNAHYRHANTETIVGHATLSTGAQPSVHGMIGNVWYDSAAEELSYNIEDPDHPILPSREEETRGEQVDPAQKLARTRGRSPVALLAETFGDKLSSFTGGKAKVFGVSGKDRSAVAMAGHTGKAFWYSTDNGDFVTSTYYYDEYPDWVAGWNSERRAESWAGKSWELILGSPESYRLGHQDDRPYEMDLRGYGRTFPHRFGDADGGLLYTQLLVSPVGDRLLADFAKKLITNEELGQDGAVDYLSVSFSGVDAINHFFGPSSLENEDVVLQLDSTLADFLAFVDEHVGLEHTLIVLSADHGAAEMPEYMTELGYTAGRLYTEEVAETANRIAKARFGLDDAVRFFYRPYLYLDREKIEAAGLDFETAREIVAAELTTQPGIERAVTPRGLEVPGSELLERIRNNYNPDRTGDIYVVQQPYWFNFERGPIASMHGSPWNYDTHVPLIFVAPPIASQAVHRRVEPADVAPTLAALLGMSPPASAEGDALVEVLPD